MKTIKIKELVKYSLAKNIEGFGMCGYNFQDGGYIYADVGFGNNENYLSAKTLISTLVEDGHNTDQEIEISLNDKNEIKYTHFYV